MSMSTNAIDNVFNLKMQDGNIVLVIDDRTIDANCLARANDNDMPDDARMDLAIKKMNVHLATFESAFFGKSKNEVLEILFAFFYWNGRYLTVLNSGEVAKSAYKGKHDSVEQMLRSNVSDKADPDVFDLVDFSKFKMKNTVSHNGHYFKKEKGF